MRADTTAPVFNDEETRARATTQVHKVGRGGYSIDVGTFAFWAGCDSATTLFAGARHVGVLRLLFARGLRLRRKWRDVVDQLGVVFVHAPDVSARTAIVRDSRELARERQMFGGILPTRRTGRTRHVGKSSFFARNVPAEPSDFAPRSAPSGPLVRPKSWEVIPFVSFATARQSFACRRTLEIRGWGGLEVRRGLFRDRLSDSRNILRKRFSGKTKVLTAERFRGYLPGLGRMHLVDPSGARVARNRL